MDKNKLQALANELAKDVKIPEDLNTLSTFFTISLFIRVVPLVFLP